MTQRVVITGFGMVSPLANSAEETWEKIKAGQSGVGPITLFDASNYAVKIAAEVKNFDAANYMPAKEVRRRDRYQQFAVAAAMQAIEHAKFKLETDEQRERAGVFIGSAVGGVSHYFEQSIMLHETGDPRRVTPFGVPMLMPNGASGMVSIEIGAMGPSYTPTSACATGADCIGTAYDYIRRGRLDYALAGAGEAPIIPIGVAAFDRIGACSRRNDTPHESIRPFAGDRDGLVFAEGAGVLVMESLEAAQARGATIYGEVLGYGSTSDAFHITAPHPEAKGAINAMRLALNDANVSPQDVDYINAHGTATQLNDSAETMAVKAVFGEHAYKVPMSSTKSMTGHGMGMTGAIEAIFVVQAMRDSILPPTINLHTPDPACDLDYVPNTARSQTVNVAMSNSFGFGGHNVSLIFKRFQG